MKNLEQIELEPALRLDHSRAIRTAADAIAVLRDHEVRPGVDDRDEVLHQIERAQNEQQMHEALDRFRRWFQDWGSTIPTTTKPGSTRGPVA
jgi:hypothetical protein